MLKNIFTILIDLITHYWLFLLIMSVSWSIIYTLNNSKSFVELFMFDRIEKLYSQNIRIVIRSFEERESGLLKWLTAKFARFLVFHSRKTVIIIELYYIITLFVNANNYVITETTTASEIISKLLYAATILYLVLLLLALMGFACTILKKMFQNHKELMEIEAELEMEKYRHTIPTKEKTVKKKRKKMDKNVRGMEHDVDIRQNMENVPNYDDNNYSTEEEENKENK